VTDEVAEWRQEYLKEHRQAKLFSAEVERLRDQLSVSESATIFATQRVSELAGENERLRAELDAELARVARAAGDEEIMT
jgi:hypothetical protein